MWPEAYLVRRSIQDEFSPNSIVLWTAVVKQRICEVGHPFTAETVATAEEHSILWMRGTAQLYYSSRTILQWKQMTFLFFTNDVKDVITSLHGCTFSSKSRTPMMLFMQSALQPTKPTWQSKKGSPIIRTWPKEELNYLLNTYTQTVLTPKQWKTEVAIKRQYLKW